MSDGYPLGADCDLDALVWGITIPRLVREAIELTIVTITQLLGVQAASTDEAISVACEYAADLTGLLKEHPLDSPPTLAGTATPTGENR